MAGLGDSFMLPKPGQDTEHLWVLITQPNPQTHAAIMVNVTTQRPHSDTTTILNEEDHPFVQKPSVIFYADARMVEARLLDQSLASGAFRTHATFQAVVLKKIQDGVMKSPFTPGRSKRPTPPPSLRAWLYSRPGVIAPCLPGVASFQSPRTCLCNSCISCNSQASCTFCTFYTRPRAVFTLSPSYKSV